MARPVTITRTGALPSEIDIEGTGCGIFVPPEDADAIAEAINYLGDNPEQAADMGRRGRTLAERYYNIERYATDLYEFFDTLS
jgi:glycosyltransferase involved in cell wall biosynthesis